MLYSTAFTKLSSKHNCFVPVKNGGYRSISLHAETNLSLIYTGAPVRSCKCECVCVYARVLGCIQVPIILIYTPNGWAVMTYNLYYLMTKFILAIIEL